ncbi:MAG: SEL1-like repeat protein [Clostridia bacterium]|nr:SEL1-like repeat protein [Clostridia bacterium]
MKLHPYICISYVNLDIVSAEDLRYRLERNGFSCRMADEFLPMAERTQTVRYADMLIAVTSSAAALGTSVASDLRQAKAEEKDILVISLEPAELDARFCTLTDTGIEAISYPVGEFPDKRSVALFIHRAFVRHICRHYACFSPGKCEDSDEGRVICDAVLAHKGEGKSQYRLGLAYTEGVTVPAMEAEAAGWINRAAAQNVPDALIRMGQLRLDGKGIERDNHEAYRLFTAAAKEGDSRGAYYMGICCLNGFGIMRDSEMAVRYFYTSAMKGYAPAAYQLALLYRDGVGIASSFKRALWWLWKAASPEGDAPVPGRHGYRREARYKCVSMRHMRQNKMGRLLFGEEYSLHSLHRENSMRDAMILKESFSASKYKKIAKEECLVANATASNASRDPARFNKGRGYSELAWDSSMAAYELGRLLESGSASDGILPDSRAALYWYRAAVRRNHSDAYVYLASCYKRGFGVLRDVEVAYHLYMKAAVDGNERAQYNLAVAYERGEGVERNPGEAVRWYEPAANAGYAPAQNNLGGCYENAFGVEQNILLAVDWYSRASDQGQPDATCRLGLCYEMGRGVVKDEERAVRLYREAARARHPFAEYRLGVCYDRGIGLHQHFARAAEYYEMAAESGLAAAQYALALCYRSGRGIFRDDSRSFELFRRAADGGCLQAAYETGCSYLEGRTTVANPERAIEYLTRAIRMYDVMSENSAVFREDCIPPAEAMTITEATGEALYTLAYCKLYGVSASDGALSENARRDEALRLCCRAAELGSSRALAMLGDFANFGIMGEQNRVEARKYYEQAVALRNDYAMFRLGLYDFEDGRTSSDEKEKHDKLCSAWSNFSAASGSGNPDALIYLAALAMAGEGTSKNPYRAVSLLERAVDSGASPIALLMLGDAYLYGNGVKINEAAALNFYSRAASVKSRALWTDKYALRDVARELSSIDLRARAEALYRLSVFHAVRENDIVPEEDGDIKAKRKILKAKLTSTEERKNPESLKYLGAAILAGHKKALEDTARMFAHNTQAPTYYKSLWLAPDGSGVRLKPTVVYNEEYTPSFLKGDVTEKMRADALNYLGDCYFYGKQVDKDASVAVKFYRMAADMGQTWAQYSLGWCLLNACGTEKNLREAVSCFERSAKTHAESAFCLGRCYEEGLGMSDPDVREALKFYRRAAKLGSRSAPAKIKAMEKRLREMAAAVTGE